MDANQGAKGHYKNSDNNHLDTIPNLGAKIELVGKNFLVQVIMVS